MKLTLILENNWFFVIKNKWNILSLSNKVLQSDTKTRFFGLFWNFTISKKLIFVPLNTALDSCKWKLLLFWNTSFYNNCISLANEYVKTKGYSKKILETRCTQTNKHFCCNTLHSSLLNGKVCWKLYYNMLKSITKLTKETQKIQIHNKQIEKAECFFEIRYQKVVQR